MAQPFLSDQYQYVSLQYITMVLYGIPCMLLQHVPGIGLRRGRPWMTPHVMYDFLQVAFDFLFLLNIQFFIIEQLVLLHDTYLSFMKIGWLDGAPNAVQALVFWIAYDFVHYWSHRWRHEIPWMWRFHTIHHSQRSLNPLTTYRGHMMEYILQFTVRMIPLGIIGGSAGTLMWLTIYTTFLSFWLHTAVRVNMGPFRYVLVGPQHHMIHHSIERAHWNKNYSEGLFVWDLLFGTAHTRFDEYPESGVESCNIQESSRNPLKLIRTYWANLWYPFQKITKSYK